MNSNIFCKLQTKENNNNAYIFFASTYFHALSSLIFIFSHGIQKQSILYIKCQRQNIIELAKAISSIGIYVFANKTRRGFANFYFPIIKDKAFYHHVKSLFPNHKIIFMNHSWNLKHIYFNAKNLYKMCDEVICIEEGATCYANFTGGRIKTLFKRIIGDPYYFYKDKKTKRILVSIPEKYPSYFSDKLYYRSIFDEWKKIDDRNKNKILNCFIGDLSFRELFDKTNKRTGIVFTQPLSEDGFVSERRKIDIYKRICEFYSNYGIVIIKPHPRDTTTYSFNNIFVLDRYWPSELLKLSNVKISFAIGICTSAIYGVDADFCINLNESFLKELSFDLIPIPS